MIDNQMISERLKLYFSDQGIQQKDIAARLGVSQAAVSALLNGKPFGKKVAEKWGNEFGIKPNWLITGEGEMLKGEADTPPRRKGMIRYWVDVEATGSGVMSFDDGITGRYTDMLIPDFRECTDAINLYGDSMAPLYKSGCILILQEWKERFIDYGLIYLIITTSGYRMVKYLQPGSVPDKITCVSENREKHPPFEIELAEVARLYLVKGSIEKNTL